MLPSVYSDEFKASFPDSKYSEFFAVSYHDPEYKHKQKMNLINHGVCVTTDVYTLEECTAFTDEVLHNMGIINPALQYKEGDYLDLRRRYRDVNLMPQTPAINTKRKGMHQHGYSFMTTQYRQCVKLYDINVSGYQAIKPDSVDCSKLYVSRDGINIRPPKEPFQADSYQWDHLDQTIPNDPYNCIQSQVVHTNTNAGFKCSPGGHHVHTDILERYGMVDRGENPRNFFIFGNKHEEIREMVEKAGGQYQIPFIVPAGSVIQWLSSLPHSAQMAVPPKVSAFNPRDKYKWWRHVSYISYRPVQECDPKHAARLMDAEKYNKTTNHWGTTVFNKATARGLDSIGYDKRMWNLIQHPEKIYDLSDLKRTPLTSLGKRLMGYLSWDEVDPVTAPLPPSPPEEVKPEVVTKTTRTTSFADSSYIKAVKSKERGSSRKTKPGSAPLEKKIDISDSSAFPSLGDARMRKFKR